ncbi:unnamed protein product [Arabidopsis lyrata]|nr:unnamed protein product [Arabidopsis lyrata]
MVDSSDTDNTNRDTDLDRDREATKFVSESSRVFGNNVPGEKKYGGFFFFFFSCFFSGHKLLFHGSEFLPLDIEKNR